MSHAVFLGLGLLIWISGRGHIACCPVCDGIAQQASGEKETLGLSVLHLTCGL